MNIDEILSSWEEDARIDRTELGEESIKIPRLHHKYYTMYVQERLKLRALESRFKQLKLEKYEFYTQGHTTETREKNWKLPPRGMILKGDVPLYMDADPDLSDLSLKISMAEEKTQALSEIVKSLKERGWQIRNALEDYKFKNGG